MEKVSNYEVMKEMGKKTGRGLLYPVEFFYTFPTFTRHLLELGRESWNDYHFIIPVVVLTIPFISGVSAIPTTSVMDELLSYSLSPSESINIALMTGFATNTISGIYEIYRHTKKKMQGKLEKQGQKGKGLENTLNVSQ